jgi:hypothetical protein
MSKNSLLVATKIAAGLAALAALGGPVATSAAVADGGAGTVPVVIVPSPTASPNGHPWID